MHSKTQHAYLDKRSIDAAIHNVVRRIKAALKNGEFVLDVFLDISGALSDVTKQAS